MLRDKDKLRADQPRLLGVDNEMVVPVNKTVRVLTIGAEVIHAFAVPSFGIKIDAIPGRLNETWFKATREGIYYGQCSELCGKDHAFMPIAVRVVSEQAFNDLGRRGQEEMRAATATARRPNVAQPLTRRLRVDALGGRQRDTSKEPTMATRHSHGAHDSYARMTTRTSISTHHPTGWRRYVYSTNHKDIGTMYLMFAIMGGSIGGILSIGMRSSCRSRACRSSTIRTCSTCSPPRTA